SLGILFEDLWATYSRLASGHDPVSLRRSAGFMEWALRLQEFARSDAALREAEYWRGVLSRFAADQASAATMTTVEAAHERVSVSLNESETRALLLRATRRFRAEANELLLTALCVAYSRIHGSRALLIELIRHGRASGIGNIDVSRT